MQLSGMQLSGLYCTIIMIQPATVHSYLPGRSSTVAGCTICCHELSSRTQGDSKYLEFRIQPNDAECTLFELNFSRTKLSCE